MLASRVQLPSFHWTHRISPATVSAEEVVHSRLNVEFQLNLSKRLAFESSYAVAMLSFRGHICSFKLCIAANFQLLRHIDTCSGGSRGGAPAPLPLFCVKNKRQVYLHAQNCPPPSLSSRSGSATDLYMTYIDIYLIVPVVCLLHSLSSLAASSHSHASLVWDTKYKKQSPKGN